MCEDFGRLKEKMENVIDYVPVNEQIAKETERSMNYLKSCTE